MVQDGTDFLFEEGVRRQKGGKEGGSSGEISSFQIPSSILSHTSTGVSVIFYCSLSTEASLSLATMYRQEGEGGQKERGSEVRPNRGGRRDLRLHLHSLFLPPLSSFIFSLHPTTLHSIRCSLSFYLSSER